MSSEKLELEEDSGEEMEDLRASLAVNGEMEEPHEVLWIKTKENPQNALFFYDGIGVLKGKIWICRPVISYKIYRSPYQPTTKII